MDPKLLNIYFVGYKVSHFCQEDFSYKTNNNNNNNAVFNDLFQIQIY